MAQLNDNGEVHVAEQFVGRLDGFRFQLDPDAGAEQAQTLKSAALPALPPALFAARRQVLQRPRHRYRHDRAGRPDVGRDAVGKLQPGADPLSPQIRRLRRRGRGAGNRREGPPPPRPLDDRRIATLFQPLVALRDDETLTGMARGIAFRLVEAMGVLPRGDVADDVKSLDQDGRAACASTASASASTPSSSRCCSSLPPLGCGWCSGRCRRSFEIFPNAPPPGLVTVPARAGRARGLLPACRLPPRRAAGDPHRHARASRRHDPPAGRPRWLRGDARHAFYYRPLA